MAGYLSYIRDTFTLLLNTPLAESKPQSTLSPLFPMTDFPRDRGHSMDSKSTATGSSCSQTDDISLYTAHSRTSSRATSTRLSR